MFALPHCRSGKRVALLGALLLVFFLTSVSPNQASAQTTISINSGGSAASPFVADEDFSGGSTSSTTAAITTTNVSAPVPPQAVFQTERYGDFTYTIGGFAANTSAQVHLYFAEIYWSSAGQRAFNVIINGTQVLTNFDIIANTGGKDIAIQENFGTTTNGSGQVVIQFTTGTHDLPKVSGIIVSGTSGSGGGATPTPTPAPTATPTPIPGEGPFGGTAAAVPGTVQAENYDTGGSGVAYHVTAVNGSDNGYRSDGVDLEVTTDTGGGVDLGWTAAGQWFHYTVNVATAGTYTVTFRVAAPTAVTDGFHLSNSSGTNLSGNVNVPATGGWQTWTNVTASVNLPAGKQVLTLNQDNGGWNINYMSFASGSGGGPTPTPTPTASGGGTGSCSGIANISAGGVTYTPSWCQEFNGAAGPPDTSVWHFDLGNNGGWGNGEQEVYCGPPGYAGNPSQCPTTFSTSTAPVYVDGSGHLVIQVRNSGGTWLSGRLNTSGMKTFQYGIVEASIKLPNTTNQGLWPAFWMLGNNINSGVAWPTCGESDIMENWSPQVLNGAGTTGNNSTDHTAKTGGSGVGARYTFPSGEATNTAFHTYGMIWQANEQQFFVDNPSTPFFTLTPSGLPSGDTWPFNQPMFLITNIAVGGTLGGSTSGLSNPDPMTIDYIRYYQ